MSLSPFLSPIPRRSGLRFLSPAIFTQLTYGFDFIARVEFLTPETEHAIADALESLDGDGARDEKREKNQVWIKLIVINLL